MKHRPELDEYVPNAAATARAADRARIDKDRQQADARAALSHEDARRAAEPIEDADQLARSVGALAAGWGLKKKGRK